MTGRSDTPRSRRRGSRRDARRLPSAALGGRAVRKFADSIGRTSYSRADVDRIIACRYGMTLDEFVSRLRSGRPASRGTAPA